MDLLEELTLQPIMSRASPHIYFLCKVASKHFLSEDGEQLSAYLVRMLWSIAPTFVARLIMCIATYMAGMHSY